MVSASVVIPTKNRPDYLRKALGSIARQVERAGGEIVVIDDGELEANRTVAAESGARYVAFGEPRGINAARNTGVQESSGELICFLDDDIVADDNWVANMLEAANKTPEIDVFAGPIRPQLAVPIHTCPRNEPPITALELGNEDQICEFAWGANMAIRRDAFMRVGMFDEAIGGCGDEEDWQRRYKANGGEVLYVANAGIDHVRTDEDSKLRSLMRASFHRGRFARRYDVIKRSPPASTTELRTFVGCCWHAITRRCSGGVLQAAHAAGRIKELIRPGSAKPTAPSITPDFLSGESGLVAGMRARTVAKTLDTLDTLARTASGQRRMLRQVAQEMPAKQRILALSVVRNPGDEFVARLRNELLSSRHDLQLLTTAPGESGKFQNINQLLQKRDASQFDWLLLVDDDIELPPGFVDEFIFAASELGLKLAQPAHRAHSHAAWSVTRRRRRSFARETNFVEIGPVTALHRDTFGQLLPFPDLRMGWGLDAHWAAVAKKNNWRVGVIDATAIAHRSAPVASEYPREEAIAEAEGFLSNHDYLPASELQRTLVTHRGWQS